MELFERLRIHRPHGLDLGLDLLVLALGIGQPGVVERGTAPSLSRLKILDRERKFLAAGLVEELQLSPQLYQLHFDL